MPINLIKVIKVVEFIKYVHYFILQSRWCCIPEWIKGADAMDSFDRIKRMAGQLSEPENFFSGSRLPENFAMPDNILCFFHDRSDFTTYTHTRYSLVFPQGKMIYFIDQKQYDADIDEMLFIR